MSPERATEPTRRFLDGFTKTLGHSGLALVITVVFVVISQIKINAANGNAGSPA